MTLTEPRLGLYRDGDIVSRQNAKELFVPRDWVLYRVPDGEFARLFRVGGQKQQEFLDGLGVLTDWQMRRLTCFDKNKDLDEDDEW